MTVSFFLKRAKNDKKKGIRDAITYGLSIVIIYLALGLTVTAIAGPSTLNALSTSAVFNIILFLLLAVFAFSFFGWFEIKLPDSWGNAVDNKASSTTGLISIFLMAFTLVPLLSSDYSWYRLLHRVTGWHQQLVCLVLPLLSPCHSHSLHSSHLG